VFFFQAEDGIRDLHVTGVQTCALPILDQRLFKKHIKSLAVLALYNLTDYQVRKLISNQELLKQLGDNPYALYEEYEADENDLDRSEERRVGKESRSGRWGEPE